MQVTLTVTVDDLAAVLRLWQMHAGMSSRDLAVRASELLPGELTISYMTVQRYLHGDWPRDVPDPLIVAALARAMGRDLGELPEECLGAIEEARRLLTADSGPKSPQAVPIGPKRGVRSAKGVAQRGSVRRSCFAAALTGTSRSEAAA